MVQGCREQGWSRATVFPDILQCPEQPPMPLAWKLRSSKACRRIKGSLCSLFSSPNSLGFFACRSHVKASHLTVRLTPPFLRRAEIKAFSHSHSP